jgi:hypothetical protein
MSNATVSVAPQTALPARRGNRRWLQVLTGCGIGIIGIAKLCNGLILLTGATKYGALLEVNHAQVYYTTAVSQEDAKALGAFLVEA